MLGPLLAAYLAAQESDEEEQTTSRRRQHKFLVNPYLRRRQQEERFKKDFHKMVKNPMVFIQKFNMSESEFNYLFSLVEPCMVPKRNSRPDGIPLKAKFAVVLEYFATGKMQSHMSSIFRISKLHLGHTISLVCNAIHTALRGEFPKWNSSNMLKWAAAFKEQLNFPNCIGAIDGMHVAIKAPPKSGCAFLNDKDFHSIVLIAVSDASSRFTYVDVGAMGSDSFAGVFADCSLGSSVLSGEKISFPEDNLLNGISTPYYFVADYAFPLHERIMRPYGSPNLSSEEQIFNDRLSPAHRCIENAFGILSNRWRVVQRTFQCGPDKAQNIVYACCCLHNFMMRTGSADYTNTSDWQAIESDEDIFDGFDGLETHYPKYVRNSIKDFLNCTAGSDPCQNESAGVIE